MEDVIIRTDFPDVDHLGLEDRPDTIQAWASFYLHTQVAAGSVTTRKAKVSDLRTIYNGNCLDILPSLDAGSVQCCLTSPPYWGLRDYGHAEQLGHEALHDCLGWATGDECGECYVCHLVAVFREVRRVLKDDGVLWLNLGDSYAATGKSGGGDQGGRWDVYGQDIEGPRGGKWSPAQKGLKPKDLAGIPWRVALALQADGWYLRSDVVWSKPNPMPESVRDRPTKAHEYVFLLTKSKRYWWDQEAAKEPSEYPMDDRKSRAKVNQKRMPTKRIAGVRPGSATYKTRNIRTVWTIPTQPFPGAHFAVMAPKLAEKCILSGCPEGGTVLDPFGGVGTTGLVAQRLGRHAILIELSQEYSETSRKRIFEDDPLFSKVALVRKQYGTG